MIAEAIIRKATIQIIQSEKITADYIKAGVSISAPLINGGQIDMGNAFMAGGAAGLAKRPLRQLGLGVALHHLQRWQHLHQPPLFEGGYVHNDYRQLHDRSELCGRDGQCRSGLLVSAKMFAAKGRSPSRHTIGPEIWCWCRVG